MSKPKTTEQQPPKPPVREGEFTFVLSTEEVLAVVQILAFSKDTFTAMSSNAQKEGNVKASEVFAARSELSGLLYDKFRDVASIGEPTSRHLH